MSLPLENIKVLDLTRVLAGPFCTMILSDLGAEIIKIEMPETGDDSRAFGPFKNGRSLYFLSINRAKKSVSLNLKSAEGKEILKKLMMQCDVLIENYRPGTMEKLGLGYDDLKMLNPRLIYAASSGFGHSGPDSLKPAYDILAQARGGIMSITGWPDTPPTRVGMSLGDITASLYTAIGINAALYHRQITGLGQKIDVAMLDCQLSILENALSRYQVDLCSPQPLGNRHPTITPFQACKAKDRYFVIAVGNDVIWERFCRAISRDDLIAHPEFATNKNRTEHIDELMAILDQELLKKDAAAWITLFENAGVPCSPINSVDDVIRDPQLLSRNMIVEVDDKDAGSIKISGNPIKMSTIPESPVRESAPEIGEHTELVLKQMLGLDDAEIASLRKSGVL